MKFETQKQIEQYLSGDKIQCLECGKWFKSLNSHINRLHSLTANEYRDKWGLPRQTALAGQSTREKLSNQMLSMREEGVIDNEHLACAAKKIDYDLRTPKKAVSAKKQKEAVSKTGLSNIKHEAGATAPSGRDLDRAREYQRANRALKKGDPSLMEKYKEKYPKVEQRTN